MEQFLAQKSIIEMEHPSCSPNLAPSYLCLFAEIKSAIKGRIFEDIEDVQKCDDATKSYSTTGVQKMFPRVVSSLGLLRS
jgi:hypothetical protein